MSTITQQEHCPTCGGLKSQTILVESTVATHTSMIPVGQPLLLCTCPSLFIQQPPFVPTLPINTGDGVRVSAEQSQDTLNQWIESQHANEQLKQLVCDQHLWLQNFCRSVMNEGDNDVNAILTEEVDALTKRAEALGVILS